MNSQSIKSWLNEKIQSLQNLILLKKLKTRFSNQPGLSSKNKMICVVLLLGFLAYIWEESHKPKNPEAISSPKSVDTFIPAGFVLVPIQLSNAEALDSMIGSRGVVDLFAPDLKRPGRSKKVAEHIKILRAPLNPNQFAVLVNEQSSSQLVHYEGAFFAVVQNPNAAGTQLERLRPKRGLSRLKMEDANESH